MRGEDLESGAARRDEHGERSRRLRMLLTVGDGSLVTVVAVRDQQRAWQFELLGRQPPDAGVHLTVVDVEVRFALGPGDGRVAVVEQEDRLELRLGCAQEVQAAL